MIESRYVWLVLGMGLVTYVPRWLPLQVLSRHQPSGLLVEWLEFIPASILSAILAPVLLTAGEPKMLSLMKPELWVAVPTCLIALISRSLGITVIFGMALFWLAGRVL